MSVANEIKIKSTSISKRLCGKAFCNLCDRESVGNRKDDSENGGYEKDQDFLR